MRRHVLGSQERSHSATDEDGGSALEHVSSLILVPDRRGQDVVLTDRFGVVQLTRHAASVHHARVDR